MKGLKIMAIIVISCIAIFTIIILLITVNKKVKNKTAEKDLKMQSEEINALNIKDIMLDNVSPAKSISNEEILIPALLEETIKEKPEVKVNNVFWENTIDYKALLEFFTKSYIFPVIKNELLSMFLTKNTEKDEKQAEEKLYPKTWSPGCIYKDFGKNQLNSQQSILKQEFLDNFRDKK